MTPICVINTYDMDGCFGDEETGAEFHAYCIERALQENIETRVIHGIHDPLDYNEYDVTRYWWNDWTVISATQA